MRFGYLHGIVSDVLPRHYEDNGCGCLRTAVVSRSKGFKCYDDSLYGTIFRATTPVSLGEAVDTLIGRRLCCIKIECVQVAVHGICNARY